MRRYEISEEQWENIKDKLPCQPGYQGKSVNNRLFVNAVMFVAKCGIPRGAICRSGLVTGIRYMYVSEDGQKQGYGKEYLKPLQIKTLQRF